MFKQRKNRTFNYKPRYQDSETKDNEDFESKWREVRQSAKKRGRIFFTLPVMIIVLVAIIVLMYILNGYMK